MRGKLSGQEAEKEVQMFPLTFLHFYWTHGTTCSKLVGGLDKTSLLGKTVNGVVAARLLAEVAADGEGGDLTIVHTTLINIGEVDLHGSVILRSDQAVGGRALAGDVKINTFSSVVLHYVCLA